MIIFLIVLIVVLLLLWSVYLPFYREKTVHLEPNEDKCFAPECKSIVRKNNNNKAILFIHGFPTTPNMYAWASEYAFLHDYDVYVPLIPSFGTDPKDMIKTNFSSWFDYIDRYYQKLREEYQEVYVIGVSMGGAMTLKLAEKYSGTDKEMKKIAVLSAPVVYNSIKDGVITSASAYLGRILKFFIPSLNARNTTTLEGHNDGDEKWFGYLGTFPRQGISLIYNLKFIRKDLPLIKVPMIAIHDRTDKTVPFKNLLIIKAETNTDSEFIETEMGEECIHSHHSLLKYESCRKGLMDRILDFFK